MSSEKLKHRGRFQAQGGGLEESENWAQEEPLSLKSALSLLLKLKNKLSPTERTEREKSFIKADKFIKTAATNGGVFARISRTFLVKGSRDKRVDIEVLSGKAFTPEND